TKLNPLPSPSFLEKKQIMEQMNQSHTSAWRFQVWAAFLLSFGLTVGGIIMAPIDLWIKGYLAMGIIFLVGSCFSLAKTIRDEHESTRFVNRIQQAKTEKILQDFEA
ncbi:MAG: YiaA/YiaB family inner membrane protein, partial [Bacteroidota bacterium]